MGMGGGGGRGEVTSDINVTPMADVMLVLLIIFMVITPMLQKGATGIDLAQTRNPGDMPEADKDDAILVAVTRDGKFYFGQDRISIDDLGAKVSDAVSARTDKTVYVKSDHRALYGDVVKIVDSIRGAGVDKIGLMTEKLDDQSHQ